MIKPIATETATKIFDSRVCTLGEGLLWHPGRQQLFWFDIIGKKMLSQSPRGDELAWQFDKHVSAAGWIDTDHLLIASETNLSLFNLVTGQSEPVCSLEANNPMTRSNDGRADPWGGFWIGTMGKKAQKEAGAIYRYYRGETRCLVSAVTIPNAICFSPDRRYGYFADTHKGLIWRQPLEPSRGWPTGEPDIFIDCKRAGVNPDGAVVDAQGNLWNAQWGASRVACYNAQGDFVLAIEFPASQISCPAFGGEGLKTLYATSATENLSTKAMSLEPNAGKTFATNVMQKLTTGFSICGQEEHRIEL